MENVGGGLFRYHFPHAVAKGYSTFMIANRKHDQNAVVVAFPADSPAIEKFVSGRVAGLSVKGDDGDNGRLHQVSSS